MSDEVITAFIGLVGGAIIGFVSAIFLEAGSAPMPATALSTLDRLLPERLRKKRALDDEQLLRLWAGVSDTDSCLRAVHEVLSRHLAASATIAGSIHAKDPDRLRAADRMECFRQLMEEIEQHRAEAKEMVRQSMEQQLANS